MGVTPFESDEFYAMARVLRARVGPTMQREVLALIDEAGDDPAQMYAAIGLALWASQTGLMPGSGYRNSLHRASEMLDAIVRDHRGDAIVREYLGGNVVRDHRAIDIRGTLTRLRRILDEVYDDDTETLLPDGMTEFL